MKLIRYLSLGILAIGFLATSLVLFQVDATEDAIVTQFGQPVRVITEPGLYAKLPDPFQSVTKVNKQVQVYNLPRTELLSADKKNIVAEAYATWQITDALLFLKNVGNIVGADTRLNDIVRSELGAALGQVELGQLVTVEADQIRLPETLISVRDRAANRTEAYGFTVTDVQLKELTFPEANLTSVFQRMRSERESIARKFRSEGTEQAARIRASADAEKAQILATANQQAAKTRGRADAEAIAIYAGAFGKDKEFYQFSRTLESYTRFIDENTTLILPSNSELLRYLDPGIALNVPAPGETSERSKLAASTGTAKPMEQP